MFRARTGMAVAASVVAAAAALGIGLSAGGSAPAHGRGPLAAAVATLPRATTVVSFTDWQHILNDYDLDEAAQRDLVTRSVLIDVHEGLAQWLGVRLRDVSWEALGQLPSGEAVVLRLKRSMPTEARLRKAGYENNKGVWVATGRLGASEPMYAAVALLPRDGVMVMGTKPGTVGAMRAVIRGRGPSLVEDRAVTDVAQALAGVQTALIQTAGLGCATTVVAVEPERARQVAAAEARHGEVVPYSVIGRGLRDVRSDVQQFRVAMTFDSAAVAAEQASVRAALSHGPFLGRSGDMSEVLRLRKAESDGPTAVLSYGHPADSEYLMTGHGPLLPASC